MSELMLMENPRRRRRRRRRNPSNPEVSAIATPLLLVAAGYLAWCGYKQYKTGSWSWQPWKSTTVIQRLRRANPLRQNSDFDRAVANMMRPADSVIENTKWTPPRTKRGDEETIGFITP